jgi:hypothetical protein
MVSSLDFDWHFFSGPGLIESHEISYREVRKQEGARATSAPIRRSKAEVVGCDRSE